MNVTCNDDQFWHVVREFSRVLNNYNRLRYPDKSNDFICEHHYYSAYGIKYDGGGIYVKKYRFLPFCWVYVGNCEGFIEGVPDCVKIVVERWFIEHTAYINDRCKEIIKQDDESHKNYRERELNNLKKLKWICK